MLEVDGNQKSGSGTILRLSIAMAAILKEPLHIRNVRLKRPEPGLRPQHLESVLTAAKLCKADIDGASLGSRELWFYPNGIKGGNLKAKINTAGSISMLILTVLPICAYARNRVKIHILGGGTDVRHAPTINYVKCVFLPVLNRMGLNASLTVKRFGYYPKGMGEAILEVNPTCKLVPINMEEFGKVEKIEGISVCTFLENQKVAKRQAEAAANRLRSHGYPTSIEVVNDRSNKIQKGSSIILWTETSKNVLLGGDAIGELRKSAEVVGTEATQNLLREIEVKATVDVHLADLLVPYVALAKGSSTYLTRKFTDHLDANIWLTEKILGTQFRIDKNNSLFRIQKE